LLAHGRWFSPCTPASSTTKTGCHAIAEILLKVALLQLDPCYFFFLLGRYNQAKKKSGQAKNKMSGQSKKK
jgi:hypothetical protein